MKTTALILGIIGGVWGFILGVMTAAAGSFVGGFAGLFGISFGGEIVALGIGVLLLSICGIVGGGISRGNVKSGSILLFIGSVGMIILTVAAGPDWVIIVPMLLLIVGGVLDLAAIRQEA